MKKRIKGRKPILRSLPPLAKVCADFSGFKGDENRAEHVFTILTDVIQRCRRATPQPFYAMRDVSKFFGVSLTTMSRIYGRLNREGMLTLVRSSQSIIPARVPRPRFAVRGVVCMLIWLPGFLYFLDWRKWFSQLEEELARYHFVLEPIFYKAKEEVAPDFVDRVLRFNPDFVLWSWPCDADRTVMHSFADAGVSLVIIHHPGEKYPGRVYCASYSRAMRQGILAWAAHGEVDNIVVPHQLGFDKKTIEEIGSMLEDSALPYKFKAYSLSSKVAPDYLRHLAPNQRTGIIFGDNLLYARLCAMLPKEMFEFIRRHRVMVTRQVTIHLPIGSPPPEMAVDALILPWKKLARRIATDLSKSRGITSSEPSLVEAEWRPNVPFSAMMQPIFNE